jgi:drug/metabolite transporter (DMT)-like permease
VVHLAFIFCCLVWGSSFILLERVARALGPVEIGLWRSFGGAAVLAVCWWYTARDFRPRRSDWLLMFLASMAFTAPPQVVQTYVVHQNFGHSFFGTMVAVIPLLTIIVSVPMLKIWPTQRELVGVLGGLACVWFLVDDGFDRGMTLGLVSLTLVIPLAAALCNTLIKWKLPHVPTAPLTMTLLFVAGVLLLPLELSPRALRALHLTPPDAGTVTPEIVVYLLILSTVASGLSTLAFVWMIKKKGPLYAGMTAYVVPVLALLWGVLDGEHISIQQMLAILGVLSMVALVQLKPRTRDLFDESLDEAVTPLPLPQAIEPLRPASMAAEFAPAESRTAPANSQVA